MDNIGNLKNDSLLIFKAGLEAVDPFQAVNHYVKTENNILHIGQRKYNLSQYKRIFVLGAGKASAAMAKPVENILGDRITDGILNVKYGHSIPLEFIRINEAGHPLPDESGFQGAQQIVELARSAGEKDLIFFLISGGGSALLPYPILGITLDEIKKLTQILLKTGATIHETNTLRKHLSLVKGGNLAKIAYPATLISLILSDVINDDLDTIASGPTVPDNSTFLQCKHILEKYHILEKIPSGIRKIISKGEKGLIPETPKQDDPAFQRTQNCIVGSNIQAAKAAREKAEELGYNSMILSFVVSGETRDAAAAHAAIARNILMTGNPIKKPACVISGGETTVSIQGDGLGGRNQEFVLAAAMNIDGLENTAILSCGTDGTDGPTDAAGAYADGKTIRRARKLGLDAGQLLLNNDSYHFFQPLNDLIITGPTYTNVMDLHVLIVL